MPVVKQIELSAAEKNRRIKRLLGGLEFCEDEEDLKQWIKETRDQFEELDLNEIDKEYLEQNIKNKEENIKCQ